MMQIMNNVASVHSVMGNYPKAYDLYNMVAERRRKYFGPSAPLSVALFNLGLVAFRQERYGLALDQIQDCLEIRLRMLGPTHQSTASAMAMRAHVLLKTKQPQQAKDVFLRVLHIRESSGNKSMLCMTYADVARACTALKQFAEAEAYLDKSKALCSSDPLDPRNADYAEAAGDLALAKGDNDSAREHFAECIDLYKHVSVAGSGTSSCFLLCVCVSVCVVCVLLLFLCTAPSSYTVSSLPHAAFSLQSMVALLVAFHPRLSFFPLARTDV